MQIPNNMKARNVFHSILSRLVFSDILVEPFSLPSATVTLLFQVMN
jgi:hypothetical protein